MTVYVDRARNQFGRMLMCHMLADTLDELHAMADAIGVSRKHFQNHDTPHYDICQSMRARAIYRGAKVVDRKELVELIRKLRPEAKEKVS